MILPSSYFPPIFQFALVAKHSDYFMDVHEHFVKQSFRNRCEIYGANGKLNLVIPLKKWNNNAPINEIQISYAENWQQIHWKSIESAYRSSPYFEFYEEDVKPLIFLETNSLLQRNQLIEKEIKQLMNIQSNSHTTTDYQVAKPDYRTLLSPKNKALQLTVNYPKYIQVFEEKKGFIPNLSILDLLFNLGPESKNYLQTINNPF